MSRRRILNVSTRKKSDTMLTGVGEPDGGIDQSQVTFNAGTGAKYVVACMSFMVRAPGAEDHTRRSLDVFFTGWKDNYRLYVGGGAGWAWRRIVFSSTDRFLEAALPANLQNGYMRSINSATVPTNPLLDGWMEQLFIGRRSIDWTDVMVAITDRKRLNIHSDVTRRLNPGNDSGKEISSRVWTPVKRNLRYDDSEYSDEVKPPDQAASSPWVTTGGGSPGNVYVVDFYDTMATDPTETLTVRIESKRYWHER